METTVLNQISTRTEMVRAAVAELTDALRENYYTVEDLKYINFSEITEWLGWPDNQDGGIYEQAITQACDQLIWAMS